MPGLSLPAYTLIAAMLALFAWREWQHDRERRDLYSRIMAGGLAEYATANDGRPPPKGRNTVRAGLKRAGVRDG